MVEKWLFVANSDFLATRSKNGDQTIKKWLATSPAAGRYTTNTVVEIEARWWVTVELIHWISNPSMRTLKYHIPVWCCCFGILVESGGNCPLWKVEANLAETTGLEANWKLRKTLSSCQTEPNRGDIDWDKFYEFWTMCFERLRTGRNEFENLS